MLPKTRTLAPGLVAAAVGTAIAFGVNTFLPAVSALTVAVVLGVLVGPFLPAATHGGLGWATKKFLRLGVVLLGLQLGLGQVFGLGIGHRARGRRQPCSSRSSARWRSGRVLGVSRGLSLMVATGFSICGASAIAAMDSVTDTDKEDVATGVTLVTLYGSAAIALVPLIGPLPRPSDVRLGAWAGLSVHEVAQVVAAAAPCGSSGGRRRRSRQAHAGRAARADRGRGAASSNVGDGGPRPGSALRSSRCSSSASWPRWPCAAAVSSRQPAWRSRRW